MWKRVRSFYRAFIRRRGFDDGLNEELAFHIARYTDELVRSGCLRKKLPAWRVWNLAVSTA